MNFITKGYSEEQVTYYSRRSSDQVESKLTDFCDNKTYSILGLDNKWISGTTNIDGSYTFKYSHSLGIFDRKTNAKLVVSIDQAEFGSLIKVNVKPPFGAAFIVWSSFITGLIIVINSLLRVHFDVGLLVLGLLIMIVCPGLSILNDQYAKNRLLSDFALEFNLTETEENY